MFTTVEITSADIMINMLSRCCSKIIIERINVLKGGAGGGGVQSFLSLHLFP